MSDGWDWDGYRYSILKDIGHRFSKSTFGANKIIIEIIGSRYSFGRGSFGRILEWRGELQSKE